MQYEIDFLPVGDGESGGDAIALRYGDFSDKTKQYVVVIDGGTKDSGEALVEHIKKHYGTNYVDLVIATHLHQDHTSGLTVVLENLKVAKLAMHLPWNYADDIKERTKTKSSISRLSVKLEKSVNDISNLYDLAEKKGVEVVEPFQGEQLLDTLSVLGPSEDYYKELLANFKITPEAKEEHQLWEAVKKLARKAIEWVQETLHVETLKDDYEDTTPENNSSLVLLFSVNGKRYLFTGDAGKDALTRVIEYAGSQGIDLSNIDFLDVPHHGSKRNLGPTILNKLMPKLAYISCPKEGDPKHPSRKVVNALIRRNCKVYTTKGNGIVHYGNSPARDGWTSATPEEFFHQVED